MSLILALKLITTLTIVVIVAVWLLLKRKSKKIAELIATVTPYKERQESKEETPKLGRENFSVDIETDLSKSFDGHIISASQKNSLPTIMRSFFMKPILYKKDLEDSILNLRKPL